MSSLRGGSRAGTCHAPEFRDQRSAPVTSISSGKLAGTLRCLRVACLLSPRPFVLFVLGIGSFVSVAWSECHPDLPQRPDFGSKRMRRAVRLPSESHPMNVNPRICG